MSLSTFDPALKSRYHIMQTAVGLINANGVAGVTLPALADAAEMSESAINEIFASVDEVFAAIDASLLEAHITAVDSTIARRRSLTESMQVAMLEFWKVVEERTAEHQAAYIVMVSKLGDAPAAGGGHGFSVHDIYLRTAEKWLLDIQLVHGIKWELPVPQLARLMLATLDGLILGYLSNQQGPEARRVLEVFAFQFAQHGRRVAKNYPY